VRVRLTKQGRELDDAVSTHLAGDLAAMLEPLPETSREALAASLSAILSPR